MTEKQIVFFDLDGTLLTSDLKVADSTISAIRALQEQGIETAIATGRTVSEIGYILEATGIRSFVAMNGQYMVYNGEVIYENPFLQDEIKDLHKAAELKGHDLAYYNEGNIMVTSEGNELIDKNYKRVGGTYPPVNPTLYLSKPIHLMLIFCEEGEEAFYQEDFPYFQFVRNSAYGCDIYPAGKSKATGIEYLLSYLNVSPESAFVFGDGLNDLEMFKFVKNSVAMGNAEEVIKQTAKYITTSNNKDGIRNGLELCGLLSE